VLLCAVLPCEVLPVLDAVLVPLPVPDPEAPESPEVAESPPPSLVLPSAGPSGPVSTPALPSTVEVDPPSMVDVDPSGSWMPERRELAPPSLPVGEFPDPSLTGSTPELLPFAQAIASSRNVARPYPVLMRTKGSFG
jgi:hypothetical protein